MRYDLEKPFKQYQKKVCPTCRNKVFCMIHQEDNPKALILHKGKGKVSCKNFRAFYKNIKLLI